MYEIYKKLMDVAEGLGAVREAKFKENPESWQDAVSISGKLENGDVFEISCSVKKPEKGDEDDS